MNKSELISDVLQWTTTQDTPGWGKQKLISINSVLALVAAVQRTYLEGLPIGTNG